MNHVTSEQQIIEALVARGQTVALAESLTGGLVVARLIDVPGASAAVRGGVVAYHNAVKAWLLGLDREALDSLGAVRESVAIEMAEAVRSRLESGVTADYGLATTGVAGPDADPDTGAPPGQVYLAVSGPESTHWVSHLELSGNRAEIRRAATDAALELLGQALGLDKRE